MIVFSRYRVFVGENEKVVRGMVVIVAQCNAT
jgi:hypothetical protein